MASTGVDVIEFKSDHTYTKTLSGKSQPKPIMLTGSWIDTGNQLVVKLDPVQADPKYNSKGDASTSSTTSVNGNTIMISSPVPATIR